MALSQTTQDKMQGLYTSSNVMQRPPNTLFDCLNIIYTSSGAAEARKGHPQYWEPANTDTGYDETWMGIFGHPTSETKLYILWLDSSYGRIGLFTPASTWSSNIVKQYVTPASEAAGTTANYRPLFETSTQWVAPRQIQAQDNAYIMASNGLFRTVPGEPDKIARVLPKLIKGLSQTTNKTAADADWLEARHRCKVIALVREVTSTNGVIFHPSSTIIEVNNDSEKPVTPRISVKVSAPNLDTLNNAQVEIYRTLSYPKNAAAPTDFYLAERISLAKFTFGGVVSNALTVNLDGSDSVVISSELLYYSGGLDESYTFPPVARDVLTFKDFAFYGNVTTLPSGALTFTELPDDGDTLSVTSGTDTYTIAFRDFRNESDKGTPTVPSTSGFLTSWSAGAPDTLGTESYRGVPTTAYDLVIRIASPDGNDADATYGAIPDIVTSKKLSWSASGQETTRSIKVVVDNDNFRNTGAFPSGLPGICAVVDLDTTTPTKGWIRDVFYYDDVEYIATAGKLEFTGTTSVSKWNNTSSSTPVDGIYENYPDTSGNPNTYDQGLALFYLPGTTFDSLSVYPIGSDATSTQKKGWSLKPTYYNYPKEKATSFPVGRINSLSYNATDENIEARIDFEGIDFRDTVTAYKRSIARWVEDYNADSNVAADPFAPLVQFYIGPEGLAKLYFRKVVPFLDESVETTLNIAQSTSFGTEPDLPADLMGSRSVYVPNGLILSTRATPEQVRLGILNPVYSDQVSGSSLVPLRIGRDDNPIVKLSSTFDAVYAFKEKDGIWRIQIQEGLGDAAIQSVVQIDDTVNIAAPESVQEIDGAIYFAAYEGCYRIEGGRVVKISSAIDIEFRNAITKASKTSNLNNVIGFKNESRNYYGIKIPTDNEGGFVTYVFDVSTSQWAKWDIGSDHYLYNSDGRLISHEYDSTLDWNRLRADRYTIGQNDEVDQIDLEIALTDASLSDASNVLTISRTDATTIWGSVGSIVDYGLTGQWYYDLNGTYYRVTLAKTSATVITATFIDESAVPAGTDASQDSLVYGIQARIDTNRDYLRSPSSMKQWCKFYTHVNGQCDKPKVTFEINRDESDSTLFTGNTSVTFGTEWWNLVTLVPRQQGRSNFLMARVEHSYPYQPFAMTGFTTVYRSMKTERVERT